MKTFSTLFAIFMAVTLNAQTVEEVTLDKLTDYTEFAANDQYLEFQNEDYFLQLDINELPVTGKTYTMADAADPNYTAIRCKNEIITNQYSTKEWKKYLITDLSLEFTEVNKAKKIFKMTATVEAKSGNDIIKKKFTFDAPEVINVTLDGTCKHEEAMKIYSFSAKNKGSEVKADYILNLGVTESAYAKGTITTNDLTANGNSIKVSGNDETKIKTVDLTISPASNDKLLLSGNVTDTEGVKYTINITTNDPSKTNAETYNIDFGGKLEITTEEGDVKVIAQNDAHKFIGYINSNTTNIPTGNYTLKSDSKYGDYSTDFGFYVMDDTKEGKMEVVNDGKYISIKATFKQNGNNYVVTATTNESAAINTIAVDQVPTMTFNLAGQRVTDTAKGIVIKNGKKILVR